MEIAELYLEAMRAIMAYAGPLEIPILGDISPTISDTVVNWARCNPEKAKALATAVQQVLNNNQVL